LALEEEDGLLTPRHPASLTKEIALVPILEGDWMGLGAGLDGHGEETTFFPPPPAGSDSLYRLHYPERFGVFTDVSKTETKSEVSWENHQNLPSWPLSSVLVYLSCKRMVNEPRKGKVSCEQFGQNSLRFIYAS